MSRFVTRVLNDFQEKCHSSMLHENMNIYCLMVHAKYVEDESSRKKSRDTKMARYIEGASSKNRLEIQDKPRFKKRVLNNVSSNFHKDRDEKVNKLSDQKGSSGNSPHEKHTSAKCGKGNIGGCLAVKGHCFYCRKSSHKFIDCPYVRCND